MEKSICAILDLSKSLSNFSSEVTKCLELTNITEWNGKILEEREGKIREIALILAGQCIAILLYNLSQSQSANQAAMNQTLLLVGWQYAKTRLYKTANINSRKCFSYFKIAIYGKKKVNIYDQK
ncbi:hypothetical protein A6V25_35525 [Nostoc sp. ATCC 53789]|nr:hypothetical protein A6V25_35525 [Nostoc sp. ATCC 53789]